MIGENLHPTLVCHWPNGWSICRYGWALQNSATFKTCHTFRLTNFSLCLSLSHPSFPSIFRIVHGAAQNRAQQYKYWSVSGEPTVVWFSGLHAPKCYIKAIIQVKYTTHSSFSISFCERVRSQLVIDDQCVIFIRMLFVICFFFLLVLAGFAMGCVGMAGLKNQILIDGLS